MKKYFLILACLSLLSLTACSGSGSTTNQSPTASVSKIDICPLISKADGEAIFGGPFTTKAHETILDSEPVDGVYTTDCAFRSTDGIDSFQVIARLGDDAGYAKGEFENAKKKLDTGIAGDDRKPEAVQGIGEEAFWTPAKGLVPGSLAVYQGKNQLYVTVAGFGGNNAKMLEKAKAFAGKLLEKL